MGGIVALQHGTIIKLGLIADYHNFDDPDEFMAILERNIEDFI